MTVRTKSVLIIGGTLVGLAVVLYVTSSGILLRGYAVLEDRSVQQDVGRVLADLGLDLSALKTTVDDYAIWDDTYAFIEDGNRAYADSNTQLDTFANLRLNVMLYVRSSGQVVFAKAVDLDNRKETSVPPALREYVSQDEFIARVGGGEDGVSGLLVLPEGPVLVAAGSILTSRHKGPSRGVVVFARYLNETQVRRLGEMAHVSVSLYSADEPLPTSDGVEPRTVLSNEHPVLVHPLGDDAVAGYTFLRDVYDRPAFLLRVETTRDILRQGRAMVGRFFVCLLAVGAAFGLVTFVLLELSIFSRITRLNVAVNGVARDGDSSDRVPATGRDEVANLALAINGMLDAVQRSHQARLDEEARFRAVVEQSASGICLVDVETKQILDANATFRTMLGYTPEEARLLTLEQVLVSDLESVDLDGQSSPSELQDTVRERRCRCRDGSLRVAEVNTTLISYQGRQARCVVLRDIEERKRAQDELIKIRAAMDDATDAIVITDRDGSVTYVNMAFGDLFTHTRHTISGVGIASVFVDSQMGPKVMRAVREERNWSGEVRMVSQKGRQFPALVRGTPILGPDLDVIGILLIINDLSEQKELESQLLQAQKLTSIGQLAAGIAHEINTPTQYVGDNTRFVGKKIGVLIDVLQAYGKLLAAAKDGTLSPSLVETVEATVASARVDYLCQELPAAIDDSLEGIERVSEIVRAMKEFSHPGGQGRVALDLNRAIENTITVARNEWKYVADVKTEFAQDLPLVPCLAGEFNQVILNLLVNAAQAIGDAVGDGTNGKGVITVSTRAGGGWVEIRIQDTGTGIPEAIRPRIFDPFFTTKEVGKGTGQGLAISRAVITQKHGGTIAFETEMGRGTTFIIRLPLAAASNESEKECVHAG